MRHAVPDGVGHQLGIAFEQLHHLRKRGGVVRHVNHYGFLLASHLVVNARRLGGFRAHPFRLPARQLVFARQLDQPVLERRASTVEYYDAHGVPVGSDFIGNPPENRNAHQAMGHGRSSVGALHNLGDLD